MSEAADFDELTANYDVIDIKNPDGPAGDFHKKAAEILTKYYASNTPFPNEAALRLKASK